VGHERCCPRSLHLGPTVRQLRRDVIGPSRGTKTADAGYCGPVALKGVTITHMWRRRVRRAVNRWSSTSHVPLLEEPSFEVQHKVVQLVVDRIVVEDKRVVIEHVVPTGPVRLQPEHLAPGRPFRSTAIRRNDRNTCIS
jgi:hypothetical protein